MLRVLVVPIVTSFLVLTGFATDGEAFSPKSTGTSLDTIPSTTQNEGQLGNKQSPPSNSEESIEDKLRRLNNSDINKREEGRAGNNQTSESDSAAAGGVESMLEDLKCCSISLNAGRSVEELIAVYGRRGVSGNWAILLFAMGKPLSEQFWPADWRKDPSFQPELISDDIVELDIGMAIFDGVYASIAERIGILMREEITLDVITYFDGYERRKPSELTVRINGTEHRWEYAYDGQLIDFKIFEDLQSVFEKLGTRKRLIFSFPWKAGASLLISRATPEQLRDLNALTDLGFFFVGEKKIHTDGAAIFKSWNEDEPTKDLRSGDRLAVMESVEAGLESLAKCGIKMRSDRNIDELFGLFSREEVAADWKLLMTELGGELDEKFWPDDAHDKPSYKPGYLSDDIFHFDTEWADTEGMYAEIARRIGIMMREEIALEVTDFLDGFSTETDSTITLKVNGDEHRWKFAFEYDWIDLNILDYFQALFAKLETSARLIVVNTQGQDVLLLVGTADRLRCLNELTGLDFFFNGSKPLKILR